MSKSKSSPLVFSRAFKLSIIRRMLAGEKRERLGARTELMRKDLYVWRDRFLSGGPQALRGRGRPRKAEGCASAARGETAKACPPGEGPKPRTGFGSRQSGPQCDAQPWQNYPVTGRPGRRPSSPLWASKRHHTSSLCTCIRPINRGIAHLPKIKNNSGLVKIF
jgi:hypothetical protein